MMWDVPITSNPVERSEPIIGYRKFRIVDGEPVLRALTLQVNTTFSSYRFAPMEHNPPEDFPHKNRYSFNGWSHTGPTQAECYRINIYKASQSIFIEGAPHTGHECGLYALRSLQRLEQSHSVNVMAGDYHPGNRTVWDLNGKVVPPRYRFVTGAVRAWGNVRIHGDEGWRAEFAQPIALLEDAEKTDLLEQLSIKYQIPILSKEGIQVYAKEFGE